MPILVTPLTESDIPGAIACIQEAFQNDPYNLWVYDDRSKVSSHAAHHEFIIICLDHNFINLYIYKVRLTE